MTRPFFVLRHGQTDWNKALRLQGLTDIELNDEGRAQAARAAFFFKDQGIDTLIASPLSRAFETAQIVGQVLGLDPIPDARLIERNFGLFEGLTIDAVKAHRRELSAAMHQHPDLDGRHYPVEAHRHDQTCLFVTHGIPFRVISKHMLGEMHFSPNACPVVYRQGEAGWTMTALDPDYPTTSASLFEGPTTMGRL